MKSQCFLLNCVLQFFPLHVQFHIHTHRSTDTHRLNECSHLIGFCFDKKLCILFNNKERLDNVQFVFLEQSTLPLENAFSERLQFAAFPTLSSAPEGISSNLFLFFSQEAVLSHPATKRSIRW